MKSCGPAWSVASVLSQWTYQQDAFVWLAEEKYVPNTLLVLICDKTFLNMADTMCLLKEPLCDADCAREMILSLMRRKTAAKTAIMMWLGFDVAVCYVASWAKGMSWGSMTGKQNIYLYAAQWIVHRTLTCTGSFKIEWFRKFALRDPHFQSNLRHRKVKPFESCKKMQTSQPVSTTLESWNPGPVASCEPNMQFF